MKNSMLKRKGRYTITEKFRFLLHNNKLLLALGVALTMCALGNSYSVKGQTAPTCGVTYKIINTWTEGAGRGGFQGEVEILNTGAPLNGWTVSWTYASGQTIIQLWNGALTPPTLPAGPSVTVSNIAWNGNIPTNGKQSFGFIGRWSGANPAPTTFGGTCSGGSGVNVPPTVSITAPANGATFVAGANIPITATAADTDGTIARVDFFDGTTLIGSDTTAPYAATLTNATAGSHTLTARAVDNLGAGTTSAPPVVISVGPGNNPAPTVAITAPLNNATFTAPATINITATASDTAPGTVTSVEFFNGTTLLGSDTTAPYSFNWTNVPASATPYVLTARATDNGGASTTSAPISVTVTGNVPPTVSITGPLNNTGFTTPTNITVTASASDSAPGTVANVQFFSGTTPIGTPDTTAPYSVSLAGLAPGRYTLTARATDNLGAATTSAPISIGVIAGGGLTFVTNLNGAAEVPPVVTSGSGTATIILSPDETAALVTLRFSNLTSPQTAGHIHGPGDPGTNAPIIFDLDMPLGEVTNRFWTFTTVGGVTAQAQVEALKAGRLYANVHSANNPGGEIRGWFPSNTPSGGCDDTGGTGGPADIARLLEQASFGPTQAEITRIQGLPGTNKIAAWVDEQLNLPLASASNYQNLVQLQQGTFVSYPVKLRFFQNAMRNPDQLRQRVAFALSQIVVAADIGNQDGNGGDPTAMVAQYHDILTRNAFGNYRTLIREMSVSPIMGTYLTLVNSKRASANTQPDENYIRELWQLFTIGTFKLNIDGSIQLAEGRPLETYTNAEIQEGARALTGWVYAPRAGQPAGSLNPFAAMIPSEADHDIGPKTLLDGAIIQGGQTVTQDLDSVINNVFAHPNVGPFISRQLIQHLVTSNPTPAYIARVATVFNNNGQNIKGDLRAVVRAILLDPEARGNAKCAPTYGKLREPALFLTHLFRSLDATGGMWGIPQISARLGQNVFSPPSVFSFYQPDFQIVADGRTIFAPPAQLLTTSTIIQRENFLDLLLNNQIQSGGNPNPTGSDNTTVSIPAAVFTELDNLAGTPPQLVDRLNQRMMHGSMSPAMRTAVINAVSSIQNNNRQRTQTAIYIIASSMQYQLQR